MKCDSCGMSIDQNPILEKNGKEARYYCCRGCAEQNLCQRDRPLRQTFQRS